MSEIAQVISTVGFPIAAFLLMFWFCREQVHTMETTIQENTKAVNNLITYMEKQERSDIDGK